MQESRKCQYHFFPGFLRGHLARQQLRQLFMRQCSTFFLTVAFLSLCSLCLCGEFSLAADDSKPAIRIGSKKFTESVILAEMLVFMARDAGASPIHRAELGGSDILWKAL